MEQRLTERGEERQLTERGEARQLTERGEARRRQLLDYAALRFAEQGYHPTSVTDIVRGVGVGKGVFYWYFPSKDELFTELLDEAQRSLRRALRHSIADEPDPIRRIEKGIRSSMEWLAQHVHLFKLFQFARTEERFAEVVRSGERQMIADSLPHIVDGIANGEIRDDDPLALAHAMMGVTHQLGQVLVVEGGWPAEKAAALAVSFCLGGMARTGA